MVALSLPLASLFVRETESVQGGSRSRIGRRSDGEGSNGAGTIDNGEEEKRSNVRSQATLKLNVPQDGELLQDGTVRINVWSTPR